MHELGEPVEVVAEGRDPGAGVLPRVAGRLLGQPFFFGFRQELFGFDAGADEGRCVSGGGFFAVDAHGFHEFPDFFAEPGAHAEQAAQLLACGEPVVEADRIFCGFVEGEGVEAGDACVTDFRGFLFRGCNRLFDLRVLFPDSAVPTGKHVVSGLLPAVAEPCRDVAGCYEGFHCRSNVRAAFRGQAADGGVGFAFPQAFGSLSGLLRFGDLVDGVAEFGGGGKLVGCRHVSSPLPLFGGVVAGGAQQGEGVGGGQGGLRLADGADPPVSGFFCGETLRDVLE